MEGRCAHQDSSHECLPDVRCHPPHEPWKLRGTTCTFILCFLVLADLLFFPFGLRITSLRLIQPRIDLNQAAHAAVSFEQKAFQKATEKVRLSSHPSQPHSPTLLVSSPSSPLPSSHFHSSPSPLSSLWDTSEHPSLTSILSVYRVITKKNVTRSSYTSKTPDRDKPRSLFKVV